MTFYKAVITLFLVMDPLGNIPVFISMLKGLSTRRYLFIIMREMMVAFFVLVLFLYFGGPILDGLNISAPALEIAGGTILFLIALKMIFPVPKGDEEELAGEPFIVPLAIPLMAGPSALATVILFSTQEPKYLSLWFLAIVVASLMSLVVLISSRLFFSVFGARGVTAMERLMGLLLTTIAVQMFLDGVRVYFSL